MKINEKIIEILAKISEKRKTQDTYGTRNPIYLVQRRKTRTVDPEYDTVEEKRLYIPEISVEGFCPTFEDVKDGILRETPLPCDFVMELEDCGSIEEMRSTFKSYFSEEDDYYYAELLKIGYYWETVAYFLTLEDAKQYQHYQAHNLGVNRVYVDYAGYDNRGLFAQLLEVLDSEDLCIKEDAEKKQKQQSIEQETTSKLKIRGIETPIGDQNKWEYGVLKIKE